MSERQTIDTVYADAFAEARASLPGRGVSWLERLREDAIGRFSAAGFPTRKVEAFKYTNLAPLTRTRYALAPAGANGVTRETFARFLLAGPCHRLVFVGGRYRPDLSDPGDPGTGVRITTLAAALDQDPDAVEEPLSARAPQGSPLADFNTAFMCDGAVVRLDEGAVLDAPIHLVFVAGAHETPVFLPVRNLILAGAMSRATLVETYVGGGQSYWTSAVTETVVGPGARIGHYKLQAEGSDAVHLASGNVRLAEGAAYHSFVMASGARLSRHEIAALLDGGDIECRLDGTYLARGEQHVDNTTFIDHARPGSVSREVYKGVLDESAHGVFQGKIAVRPGALKTDAHQMNKNLLLSEGAQVDTKPELEIYADDVKCSHGATAGELDDEAMFYLRARGIDEDTARRLLVEAFVRDVIEDIDAEPVRAYMLPLVADWLGAAGNGSGRSRK